MNHNEVAPAIGFSMRRSLRRRLALDGLHELELMAYSLSSCVHDGNGEPDNGWEPDIVEADRLVSLCYWKTVRVRELLEDKDTGGSDIEIALYAARGQSCVSEPYVTWVDSKGKKRHSHPATVRAALEAEEDSRAAEAERDN
jgi:hypothetical protein